MLCFNRIDLPFVCTARISVWLLFLLVLLPARVSFSVEGRAPQVDSDTERATQRAGGVEPSATVPQRGSEVSLPHSDPSDSSWRPVHWTFAAVAAVFALAALWRCICFWKDRVHRRSDEWDRDQLDNYTLALRFLSERLDEKSFGFLAKRLERFSADLSKLIEAKFDTIQSSQRAQSEAIQEKLDALQDRLNRLDHEAASVPRNRTARTARSKRRSKVRRGSREPLN